MFGITVRTRDVFLIWIALTCGLEARHVPLSSQRESRPRLLVIRPPAGSGQPNRVVILTNPRNPTNEAEASRTDKSRGISLASIPGIAPAAESPPPTEVPLEKVGGHPQSAVRRKTERPPGGRRSLRTLIETINTQRQGRQGSNIARVSDTIPRAAPPMMPTENRFGNLNIPRVIEAALKRAREKARMMGNVRPHVHQPDIHSETPHAHDHLSLAHHNSAKSRKFTSSNALRSGDKPASNGKGRSGSVKGSGLRSLNRGNENRSGRRRGHVGSHSHHHLNAHNNADEMNNQANIQTKTSVKDTKAQNKTKTELAKKSRIVESQTKIATKTGDKITPILSKGSVGAVHSVKSSKSADASASVNTGSAGSAVASNNVVTSKSKPVAKLSANTTATIDAASTNNTSNTTSKKSVKTKTIQVTTVVKGGTAADVAAAAASQAEIAQAVSSGKDLNSTSIAAIAKAAAEKNLKKAQKKAQPPPGSITVKRVNGVSVITLADGIGEPVVIRATGPVKIDRIIKPDGKVQFVISPVETSPKPRTTRATSMEAGEPLEFPEETTTSAVTTTMGGFTPTTEFPVMFESSSTTNTQTAGQYGPVIVDAAVAHLVSTTTTKPATKTVRNGKRAGGKQGPNVPVQRYPVFTRPKIPRPPPTIPRPPRVPDSMFGNQGLLDSMAAASLFSGSNELHIIPELPSSTPHPHLAADNAIPSNIHSFTSATDVMPQYDVVQKASKDFIVK